MLTEDAKKQGIHNGTKSKVKGTTVMQIVDGKIVEPEVMTPVVVAPVVVEVPEVKKPAALKRNDLIKLARSKGIKVKLTMTNDELEALIAAQEGK